MKLKTKIAVVGFMCYAISLFICVMVDWRLFPAMVLFGWAMNLENRNK